MLAWRHVPQLESTTKLRAVLVEDEEHSLSRLRRLLSDFPQDIEVVGEAVDGPSAVETIRATAPDIVFLDIHLPGFNGFGVLEKLDRQPIVIFTTAFNQHALDAFKVHAVDYLLKPIENEAIAKAIAKLRAMGCDRPPVNLQVAREVARLLDSAVAERFPTRIACKEADWKDGSDRTVLVKLGEILYFQADHKYTAVHTANREFLIDTPLIDLERKVGDQGFTRIHRSTLVNISWIAEIRRSYDSRMTVLLKDAKGTALPVSRHYAENLRNICSGLFRLPDL